LSAPRGLAPEHFTLPNGLRFLLVENHRTPAIAMTVSTDAGARDEGDDLAGTAMMASRLLEEGTATRSSLEIADAIESVGGAIDTDCSFDRLAVTLSVLAGDIDLGLDLVADMLRDAAFPEDSMENERERTLAEIRSAMDRPQVRAGWQFNELVYAPHALRRPVHGYPETIPRIRREHLVDFHRRYIVPERTLVSVVGEFRIQDLKDRLSEAFGSWEPADRPAGEPPASPERVSGKHIHFVEIESQQAHVYFGHLGVARTHPDFYTLQVMDTILGGGAGLTSRIPRKLRDDQGLAYTTFASITNSAGRSPGKFLAYMGTSPGNVDAAIAGFVREIDQIRSELVSEAELRDAKAYLTGSFVFGFETNAQVAQFLVNAEVFGLGFDYLDRYPAYVEPVTADALRAAAAEHLSTRDYVLVVAGPDRPAFDAIPGI
jgi:zinc protease